MSQVSRSMDFNAAGRGLTGQVDALALLEHAGASSDELWRARCVERRLRTLISDSGPDKVRRMFQDKARQNGTQ